jgi:hypothetical protein
MAIRASSYVSGPNRQTDAEIAGDVVCTRVVIPVLAAQIVLNDIIDAFILPAYHFVTDMILVPDDLDTGGSPTLALDVGIMSGTPGDTVTARTCGNEYFAATLAGVPAATSRMTKPAGFLVAPVAYDRSIGIKYQAAAATPAAGNINLMVFMTT